MSAPLSDDQSDRWACSECGHEIDHHGGFVNIIGCLDCDCSLKPSDLVAAMLAEARAEGAAEVRVRVEAKLRGAERWADQAPFSLIAISTIRAALADPEADK